MTIEEYQDLTGTTVSTSKEALYTAQIAKTQRILEDLLGFTLDPDLYDDNQYDESGKTSTECPCPSTTLTLTDPDSVVFAYRLFEYNDKDKFLSLDPCSTIHAVKLIKDNVTYRTFETDEYRANFDRDIIRFLEVIDCCCTTCCNGCCKFTQLAIDATWLWSDGNIPLDLQDVWAEMVTYYVSLKKDIKSETLGPHSYTRFSNIPPEQLSVNEAIIKKYAGPHGSIKRTITV